MSNLIDRIISSTMEKGIDFMSETMGKGIDKLLSLVFPYAKGEEKYIELRSCRHKDFIIFFSRMRIFAKWTKAIAEAAVVLT